MIKIAECYAGLAEKHFIPAAKSNILPLDGYNKYRRDEIGKLNVYDLGGDEEKKHLDNLKNDYDKCIYLMVRNVFKNDGGRIIDKLEGRER